MKTCGPGRAHPEARGQPVKRYIWNRVVLQREPHLKNWIVAWRRQVPERRYEFSKWHGVRKRIQGGSMDCIQTFGEWAIWIDLTSKGDDAGEVAHRFTRGLLRPICHGGPD